MTNLCLCVSTTVIDWDTTNRRYRQAAKKPAKATKQTKDKSTKARRPSGKQR
jgi:hypothetical protein